MKAATRLQSGEAAMSRAAALTTATLLLLGGPIDAATLSVPGNFPTIQQAINTSVAGDVIEIAPGTYPEHLTVGPAQNGITLRGTGGAALTAVDGTLSGVVLTLTGVTASCRVEGLTLRNGRNVGNPGGGLRITSAAPVIADCIVENCEAGAGGGAYVDGAGSPTFERCVIRNNYAPAHSGGGVYADYGGVTTLNYCLVYGNVCDAWGGGVTAWEDATIALDHCTIVGNQAAVGGDNAYFTRRGRIYASHTVLAFPVGFRNVEATADAGSSSFVCCDLFVTSGANVIGFPSPVGQNDNFASDPMFCEKLSGDFSLAGTSPCASAVNGSCGLVGALDAQCVAVAVRRTTWGQAKSHFR